MDYANLPIIDLEIARTPDGRRTLAQAARNAMTEHGFFYVINHGTTQSQVRLVFRMIFFINAQKIAWHLIQTDRLFDIADVPFARVSEEEKPKYTEQGNNGSYQGYKLRQYWVGSLAQSGATLTERP